MFFTYTKEFPETPDLNVDLGNEVSKPNIKSKPPNKAEIEAITQIITQKSKANFLVD